MCESSCARITNCANHPQALCESCAKKRPIARIILCANHPLRESSCYHVGLYILVELPLLATFVGGSESSTERKSHGTKVSGNERSTPGTVAPGIEWSWERKVHNSIVSMCVHPRPVILKSARSASRPCPLDALACEQDHCVVRAPKLEATASKDVPACAMRCCPHLKMSNFTA